MKLKLKLLQLMFACLFVTKIYAQELYTGVWRSGTDGYALYGGLSWSALVSKWQTLAGQNLRLVDISTYTSNGQQLYNGVWRAGTDGYALYGGVEWAAFVTQWSTLARQNLRLIDIETYVSGGKRLYVGVWRAGTDGYALYGGVDWNTFVSKWQTLAAQNLRLIDVASYLQNGVRLYTGVWRAGTDGYALYNGLDWNSFVTKWKTLAAQNLRLINISSYLQNGIRVYMGVWRAGTDGYYLWNGTDWESLTSKWAEEGAANLRLINLETYESTCTDNCLNHVLMPDNAATAWRDGYDYKILAGKQHCEGKPGTCPVPAAGDAVTYSWPNLKIGSNYYERNSVIFDAKDQIFTLPFSDKASDLWHNSWLYSPGSWHHAIDYVRNDWKTFKVTSAAPGKVIYVGWDNWSGNTMVVSHNVGNKIDAYRTIYMHLQNDPKHDCDEAWTKTIPTLSGDQLTAYKAYLNSTGCPLNKAQRNPVAANWGTAAQKIDTTLVGKTVTAGQLIAWSGSTGPGGCGCMDNTNNPNTHLHIFFAHRDTTDNHWYFFDPYGIYSYPDCYPTGVNQAINTACARYPIAWKNGSPNYPVLAPEAITQSSVDSDAKAVMDNMEILQVSPNPTTGNIIVKYNCTAAGRINLTVYNKLGIAAFTKSDFASTGNNIYQLDLSNLIPGNYFVELNNNGTKSRAQFIINK